MTKTNQSIKRYLIIPCVWAFINVSFAQTKEEILDGYIKAFNERNIEKYLEPLHDSVRLIVFPNKVTDNNKQSMEVTYTSAFNSKELGGLIIVTNQKDFGEFYIQEQSLERLGYSPVINYVLYKFRDNKIVEINYLPRNY